MLRLAVLALLSAFAMLAIRRWAPRLQALGIAAKTHLGIPERNLSNQGNRLTPFFTQFGWLLNSLETKFVSLDCKIVQKCPALYCKRYNEAVLGEFPVMVLIASSLPRPVLLLR